MIITINLPEEVIPEIYDVFNSSIEGECNVRRAIKKCDLKILFKKAVKKAQGVKGKVTDFYDKNWVKKNLEERYNDMVKQ